MTDIESAINYKFRNKKLLNNAVHHSSVKNCSVPFERLEFLGDRVLGIVIAEYIYKNFEEAEGAMAKMHSAFVCADTCRDVALKIGVDKVIKTAGDQLKQNKTVLADAMEALLGAVFIDSDYETVKQLVLDLWEDVFAGYDESLQEPKTRLQEISQSKSGETPVYELISISGPDHAPKFLVSVTALGKKVESYGHSRKDAETLAAKFLLKQFESEGNL